jgi:asparagine synthase (glutamine-hydrolysing)
MCGIFCLLGNYKITDKDIVKKFDFGYPRGPEQSSLMNADNNIIFGFHRLAINGYNTDTSEQPIHREGCILICNGEIYNWKNLASMMNIECDTGSDCEIIIHLYKRYGAEQTLQMLDGVFSFVLYDTNSCNIFIARDPHGVRPLFFWKRNDSNILFASEVKMGVSIIDAIPEQFPPGSFIHTHTLCGEYITKKYYITNSFSNNSIKYIEDTKELIQQSLIDAVRKRVDNTDREIACLLSGGLDSSLICGLVAKEFKNIYGQEGAKRLHTWSVGMKGSEDLRMAKLVADHLGTTHHEITLDEQEFIEAIPEVIRVIESNDTTTVRASVGNYLICKYIRENSDAKVVFNGDGSDEVAGGYLYFHYAPDSIEFDKECRRLLKDIHLFDVLRSDRTISCHGLEARTPFLDRAFVDTYLSIPPHLRNHNSTNTCEKYLIRSAFEEMNLLPKEVLWRRKEAFSDGVSKDTKSWFEIIQDFAGEKYKMDGKTAEQKYYDEIFCSHYGDDNYTKNIVPYKWMPRFVNASDCSARTLKIYEVGTKDNLTVESQV